LRCVGHLDVIGEEKPLAHRMAPSCDLELRSEGRPLAAELHLADGSRSCEGNSTAIFIVMLKINDQLRVETVAAYLRGTTTQEECCAIFEARTGHRLSARTLRSWVARFGASGRIDVRARVLLANALAQVRALEARLQTALDQLDGEAASPMPVRHVEASNEPLPPTATSAGSVGISLEAVPHLRGTAAGLPLGIEERATKDEPISTKFSWD
jgi:hypothetical protein